MRKHLLFLRLIFLLPTLFLFFSCQDEISSTYTYATKYPVLMKMSDIRSNEIVVEPRRILSDPGKIYIYKSYLYINEPQKGIHIFDNSNPAKPQKINFLAIAGTTDLSINSDILYADNYVDLLTFDLSNPLSPKLSKRVEDVFMHMYTDRSTGTFVSYKDTVLTYEGDFLWGWGRGGIFWRGESLAMASSDSKSGGGSYGQGGSMARFTLANEHLYTVDDYSLRVFDVTEANDPHYLKKINLGWGIETIFPFQDKLFIGSNTGMHIYDISSPSLPKKMSVYQHITACDPVVVNEKYAFVTLRSGMNCRLGVDELQVIDIQNPYQPKLIKSYPMANPHGLALSGDYLYVAEGKHGLKSFNVSDVNNIDENQLELLKSMQSTDIIAGPKSLIVIGPNGVCQFDYSTPNKLSPLSCIKVNN
jgi:hypothetical protein